MKSWRQFLHLSSFSDSNSFMTAGPDICLQLGSLLNFLWNVALSVKSVYRGLDLSLLRSNKTTNSLKRLNLLINQNNLHNLNSRAEIELVYVSPYTPLQSGDALQTLSRQ